MAQRNAAGQDGQQHLLLFLYTEDPDIRDSRTELCFSQDVRVAVTSRNQPEPLSSSSLSGLRETWRPTVIMAEVTSLFFSHFSVVSGLMLIWISGNRRKLGRCIGIQVCGQGYETRED